MLLAPLVLEPNGPSCPVANAVGDPKVPATVDIFENVVVVARDDVGTRSLPPIVLILSFSLAPPSPTPPPPPRNDFPPPPIFELSVAPREKFVVILLLLVLVLGKGVPFANCAELTLAEFPIPELLDEGDVRRSGIGLVVVRVVFSRLNCTV